MHDSACFLLPQAIIFLLLLLGQNSVTWPNLTVRKARKSYSPLASSGERAKNFGEQLTRFCTDINAVEGRVGRLEEWNP